MTSNWEDPEAQESFQTLLSDTSVHPAVRTLLAREYPGTSELFPIFVSHSFAVALNSVFLAQQCGADAAFVREAAWLHDIGIKFTHAPGIHCYGEAPYLQHGVLGRELCDEIGLHKHGLVCERHVGTGFTQEDIREGKLPLPYREMLNKSLEERLICYVDQFFSKSGRQVLTLEVVRSKIAHHGSASLERFESLQKEFGGYALSGV